MRSRWAGRTFARTGCAALGALLCRCGLLGRSPHCLIEGLLIQEIRDNRPMFGLAHGGVQRIYQRLAKWGTDFHVRHRGGADNDLAVIVSFAINDPLPRQSWPTLSIDGPI